MQWHPHTTVAAVIEQDGRFLMVRETTRNGLTVINQPAGHLERDESLIEAVIRETREETAWNFIPKQLVGIYRWTVPETGITYLRYCFTGNADDHRPEQSLDDGILEAPWMSREELQQQHAILRSPMVMRCIDDYLAGKRSPLSLLTDLD